MSNAASPLAIRDAHARDAARIVAMYAWYVTETAISFEETPPDAAEMARRIVSVTRRYPWLVADISGSVLGYAYGTLHRARPAYRWSVEVTVYVDERAQRRGIGTQLYAALFERLCALGYHRAFAGIALPNAPSEALHRAVGFERIGIFERVGYKFGAWHDVAWYQRDLQTAHATPTELLRTKPR